MDDEQFYDPLYKGATAPAMVFGVPMLPFILFTLGTFFVGAALAFAIGPGPLAGLAVLYGGVFAWARRVSKDDEHRLLQMFMRFRMRLRQRRSVLRWGAASYSPLRTRDD